MKNILQNFPILIMLALSPALNAQGNNKPQPCHPSGLSCLMKMLMADREATVKRKVFQAREYVDLRIPNKSLNRKQVVVVEGMTKNLDGFINRMNEHENWPARIVQYNGGPKTLLEIRYIEFEFNEFILVSVPTAWVLPTYTGSERIVQQRLNLINKHVKFSFKMGEKVRFRDPQDGYMKLGEIKGSAGRIITIYNSEKGNFASIDASEVFKLVSGRRPEKGNYDFSGLNFTQFHEGPPMGIYKSFLNSGARFLSHPEVQKLSDVQRAKLIQDYLKLFVGWNWSGDKLHAMGKPFADDQVVAGIGICANLPLILGHLLTEAGYQNKAVYAPSINHMYLEADVEVQGETKAYVADPSGGTSFFESFDDLVFGRIGGNQTFNKAYVAPGRMYFFPKIFRDPRS